ncbi:MAG TPA: hypothetical protein VFK05_34590 [Polyangiaceae bacterium]|nr:hypothetical protein [Polyangiaceae bacterium]
MGKNSTDTAFTFKSSLKTGAERFLAQALAHAQAQGFRTPDDFLRHFKPLDLMVALESAHELRAEILVKAAGVHQKIAIKKSTSSGAEDLRIAIEEGLTDAAAILELFPADDRVRYLEAPRLWSFLVEDEFWSTLNAEANRERAIGRMTFTLENALREDLLSLADIADGITFEMLSTRLPHKELQKLVAHALKLGRERKPLTEEALLDSVSLAQIVGYVPLEHVWKSVIVERVAKPSGFLSSAAMGEAKPPSSPVSSNRTSSPSLGAAKEEANADARKSQPPKPPSGAPRKPEESLPEITAIEDDVDKLIQNAQRPAPEEEARRRVLEKLAGISRLPPHHEALTTPVLLSIESMYSELLSASTDEARELCIRDSFPNPSQMSSALLALIELLDPSIDINDPVIRDADVDSLIKVVLFEERHRYEQAHPSLRPPPSGGAPLPPPTAGARRAGSAPAPPPLPRPAGSGGPSVPPPLPPPGGEKRAR